ncbi:MAG: ABC transporter permease subunit [Planctomycetes bacterium]|nr:ABC transporter permease subunit [Planctomycetota bacterium]
MAETVKESEHSPVSRSDWPFFVCFAILGGVYVILIVGLLVAQAAFTSPAHVLAALASPEIRYAIRLSLLSCTLTTLLSLWVAIALGYLLARFDFPGKRWIDAVVDIPIVLPPLVVGLALLLLFQVGALRWFERHIMGVTFEVPSVVLAQFTVACAFAVRTMRVTFEQISPRAEAVALTLGCTRAQAFWKVVFPEARRGLLTAATLAWARSMGEFGPILVFSGTTRMRTEVLPTTVFLEFSIGNIEAAAAVSLLMLLAAVTVLLILRRAGSQGTLDRALRP